MYKRNKRFVLQLVILFVGAAIVGFIADTTAGVVLLAFLAGIALGWIAFTVSEKIYPLD